MRARASTGALAVVAVIAGAVGLGGCAADAEQYQSDAEHFLSGDEVFAAYGIDFRDPVCTVPTSTTVGTSFACTASWRRRLDLRLHDADHRREVLRADVGDAAVPGADEPGDVDAEHRRLLSAEV